MVLLLGPLYHLVEKEQRLNALVEAKRVLKNNGLLITAGISRYASMIDGFCYDFVRDKNFVDIMLGDLESGQHHGIAGKHYFTMSYFHLPEELKKEVIEAGFCIKGEYAVESFFGSIPGFDEKLEDTEYFNIVMKTLRKIENDSAIMGISPHFIVVGRK